jgi:DNA-binding response OmpR family regulator
VIEDALPLAPGAPEPEQQTELILVVDDDSDIARFIEVNLRLQGFDVAVAQDGQEALDLVVQRRPDLAIVDLMMPRVDGLELTRLLRADPITTSMPIIMLTARGLTVDKVLGLTAGADDYLVKPFDTLELVARVKSTLRRNQEYREVSPLTGLPGNTRILREIADRIQTATPFAVGHVDIDRFKTVNDVYGFARGDEFITALARCLHRAVLDAAAGTAAHRAGDHGLHPRLGRPVRPGRRAARVRGAGRPAGRDQEGAAGDDLHRGGTVHQPALHRPARGGGRRLRDEEGREVPARLVRRRGPPPRSPLRRTCEVRRPPHRSPFRRARLVGYPPRAGGTR